MKKNSAIKYFGSSSELANQLNISKQSISQWGDDVPRLRAFEIERLTNGVLTVEPSLNGDAEVLQ